LKFLHSLTESPDATVELLALFVFRMFKVQISAWKLAGCSLASLDAVAKRNMSAPDRNQTTVIQLVAWSLY
jgi:hypothetical protein